MKAWMKYVLEMWKEIVNYIRDLVLRDYTVKALHLVREETLLKHTEHSMGLWELGTIIIIIIIIIITIIIIFIIIISSIIITIIIIIIIIIIVTDLFFVDNLK